MIDYIRFDRQSDAQESLEEFYVCLDRLSKDDLAWKYAIISIHNALQGYTCISIGNGNSFQTLKASHLKKWLDAYKKNAYLPGTKIDFFMDLYDKAFSSEVSLNRKNIVWLNDIRNNLVHFNTDGFSIHRPSAIECSKEALKAISLAPSKTIGFFVQRSRKTYTK